jgi:hypothetical protein
MNTAGQAPREHANESDAPQVGSIRAGTASAMAAVVQGLCVFAMAASGVKVALGAGSAAAAGGASLVHSDPVRYTLMVLAGLGAAATVYVVWNGWRLRNMAAARWRRRPLSRGERRAIGASLALAATSVALIAAEIWAHRVLHPK